MMGSSRILLLSLALLAGCAAKPSRTPTVAELLLEADRHTSGEAFLSIEKAKDIALHNLANADTIGFKRLSSRARPDGEVELALDVTQGALESTGRNLDVAIQGQGFFRYRQDDGGGGKLVYSRSGNLFLNFNSELVVGMGDAYRLDPPVAVPPTVTEITITSLGVIQVLVAGQVEKQTIGQIMLYQFNSPERLTTTDGRLFVPNDRSGDALECRPGENASGSLIQGFLEKSNVQIGREQARLKFLDEWRAALLHRGR